METLTEFNCPGGYGKNLSRLSIGGLELNISKQVGIVADEDRKNTSGKSNIITKINKTVDTYFYDSGIFNACRSATSLQIESYRLVKETIDDICAKIECLHLDDFEEHEVPMIKHFIQKYNNSEELGHSEILQKNMKTGQKRKVHEVYGKISSQQIGTKDEFVTERTEQVHNSLNSTQYLDEPTEISDNSSNKRIETKTLTVSPMMYKLASKYKSISPSNILDLASPISSIASAARSELSHSSKSSSASKNLSLSKKKSSYTCIAKSQILSKSKSSFSSNKMSLSVCTSKSRSSFRSQDTFKTKSSSFSKYESINASTTKSSSSTKHPSLSVSTTKSRSTSKTNSPSTREFLNLHTAESQAALKMKFSSLMDKSSKKCITKSQAALKMKFSLKSESTKRPTHIRKLQTAPKVKFSSLSKSSRTSTYHPPSRVFKKNSSMVSNERFKKQRTHVLKNIQRNITSLKTDPTKCKILENAKTRKTNKKLVSKIEKRQMENSFCIRKFKEYKKVKNPAKPTVSSTKFFMKDLPSPCTSVVDSLPQNIRKDVSVAENATELDSTVDASIKTKSEYNNMSVIQNTASASILNVNCKCSPRKRIIYDEKKEAQRRHTMAVIKAKQKLLKDKIMEGKYSHNKEVKNILIKQVKVLQSEIDGHFHHLDELGKMPNQPKQQQLVKPKVKDTEHIKNLQTLLQHLVGNIPTEVNIENIHEYINCKAIKDAFDELQDFKRKQLKKIETAKHRLNWDLQNFKNFLKLNRENIFSNASFPNVHTTDDIFSHCDSLKKAVGSNLRYLIILRFLATNLIKSVRNYKISQKLLFDKWNSFVFKDQESFFTLRKVR